MIICGDTSYGRTMVDPAPRAEASPTSLSACNSLQNLEFSVDFEE
jgi:hypothetical protein